MGKLSNVKVTVLRDKGQGRLKIPSNTTLNSRKLLFKRLAIAQTENW